MWKFDDYAVLFDEALEIPRLWSSETDACICQLNSGSLFSLKFGRGLQSETLNLVHFLGFASFSPCFWKIEESRKRAHGVDLGFSENVILNTFSAAFKKTQNRKNVANLLDSHAQVAKHGRFLRNSTLSPTLCDPFFRFLAEIYGFQRFSLSSHGRRFLNPQV